MVADAPDSVPKYIAEGVPKQSSEALRVLQDWIDEVIEGRELNAADLDVGEGEEIVDVEQEGSRCTVIKKVPCGKESCSTCPHGPYRYVVHSKGGSQRWEYKGKVEV